VARPLVHSAHRLTPPAGREGAEELFRRAPGTAGDAAAFPQLRAVIATLRTGRAALGAALGGSHDGEQTRELVEDHPEIFGENLVYLVRNFLGHDLIVDIRGCGADLIMRVKAGITLSRVRWLPDGSYPAYLTAPDGNSMLMLRVVEYTAVILGRETPELVCLATTLLDEQRYPPAALRDAYPSARSPLRRPSGRTSPPSPTPAPRAGRSCAPASRSRSARSSGPGCAPPITPQDRREGRRGGTGRRRPDLVHRRPAGGDPVDDPDPGRRGPSPSAAGRRSSSATIPVPSPPRPTL
jgi:hypothetical protein